MPAGESFLVSTSSPGRTIVRTDLDNNTAWVKFRVIRPHNGNPNLSVVGHSPCGSPGWSGEQEKNR